MSRSKPQILQTLTFPFRFLYYFLHLTLKRLFSTAMTITTSRLHLRAARESDLDAFHEMFSNPEVMRYWYPSSFHPSYLPPFTNPLIAKPAIGPHPHTPPSSKPTPISPRCSPLPQTVPSTSSSASTPPPRPPPSPQTPSKQRQSQRKRR